MPDPTLIDTTAPLEAEQEGSDQPAGESEAVARAARERSEQERE